MATITVSIQAAITVTPLNGTALDNILLWVKTNITDKVPSGTTVNVTYTLIP
jgi:hypothetical protein